MIFLPYSTALRLSRPPLVTYLTTSLCVLIFLLQISSNVTESLLYYPATWNPLKMITSSLAHADWLHLIGNMFFYMAFAPALEVLLGSRIRYLWIMLLISFAVGISYSVSTLISSAEPLPSLGFSGVVMGMIGLSAYLMPTARIRVFFWYFFMWKILYVRAWVLAVIYIGLDTWTMFAVADYGSVNVVAHVAGGFAGYLYGYLWLSDRREEVQEELAHEIKSMRIEQQEGKTRSEAHRYKQTMEQRESGKQETRNHDKFLGRIYQMVKTHRDSEAVLSLLEKYDLTTPTDELEQLFERMSQWGRSRAVLCVGRLIIQQLDAQKREGKVIVFIEKCQKISPQFVLHDVSRVLHYAEIALQTGRSEVTRNLTAEASKRYGELINVAQCRHLFEKARI
jgi:membrane associated rhomboid family serine protease